MVVDAESKHGFPTSRRRVTVAKNKKLGWPRRACHVAVSRATSQLVNEENWLRVHEWTGVNKVAAC